MRLITLLTASTIASWLRQPMPLLIMLFFPMLLAGLLYAGLQPLLKEKQWIEPFPVAIVDNEKTFETKLLLKQYQNSEELRKLMRFSVMSEKKARQKLQQNELAGIAIIPDGFTDSLWTGKNMPVSVVSNPKRGFQTKMFREFMSTNAKLISSAQAGANAAYDHAKKLPLSDDELKQQRKQIAAELTLHALDRNQFFYEEQVTMYGGTGQKSYYAVSALVLLLGVTGLYALKFSRTDTKSVLWERLSMYGINTGHAAWSALFTNLFLFLLQAGLLVALFYYVEKAWTVSATALVLLYILALVTAFSTIAELIRNETAALGAGALFIGTNALLGGVIIPLSYLPDYLQAAGEWSFMNLARTGLLDVLYGQGSLPAEAALKLAASTAVLLVIKQFIISLKKRRLWDSYSQSQPTAYESS